MSTNEGGSSCSFRELQMLRQWWILGVVAVVAALAWWCFVEQILLGHRFGTRPAPDAVVWIIWVLTGILLPLMVAAARMIVTVSADGIRIAWIPFGRKSIRFEEIESAEPRTYRPIAEYLGWGIKWVPGRGMAWNVSGNRGVQLVLRGGRKLLIGSQRAEELAAAIRNGMEGSHRG